MLFFFFFLTSLEFVCCKFSFYKKVKKYLSIQTKKDHILHHVNMAGQVLVKPAQIDKVIPPKFTSKPQPPCGSYTFYCSAQTCPQLSLLCSGHNWYFELSVTRSAPRYAHCEHRKVLFCVSSSLHTVQYFLGKYFQAQAKCNN